MERLATDIILDMRNELYPLVGKRMDIALQHAEKTEWFLCFQAATSIKMIISGEMGEGNKDFFDKLTEQIRELLTLLSDNTPKNNSNQMEIESKKAQIPGLMEDYLELLFKEMSNQGIWFPKVKRHASFEKQLMQETFGIVIKDKKEKYKKLSQFPSSKIITLLPTSELDKLAVKLEIEHVLQE